jgi:hypothetical protein
MTRDQHGGGGRVVHWNEWSPYDDVWVVRIVSELAGMEYVLLWCVPGL